MASPVQYYSSLTIGYSDSEDRLWLRFVREGGEAKLWMTRRLAMALLDKSHELLLQNVEPTRFEGEHRQAVQEFIQAKGDPAPPRAPSVQVDVPSGLVTSVDLTTSKDGVGWVFVAAQGRVGFRGTRTEAHRLLEIFWLRMQSAGWRDAPPWKTSD